MEENDNHVLLKDCGMENSERDHFPLDDKLTDSRIEILYE
jgi:hypothetical protein